MTRFAYLAAIISLLAISLQAQPYELRYSLTEGKQYRFKQIEETTALAQSSDGRGTQIERETTRYFTIAIEKSGIEGVQYVFVQDTAIVGESADDASTQRQYLDFQNIITRRPIRVRQTPSGKILSTVPLEPLNVEAILGPGASDAMFTKIAALLPALPTNAIEPGMGWTETKRDTLFPSKEMPRLGRGSGERFLAHTTEYNVGSVEDLDGYRCLKISWRGHASMEERIIYAALEEFTEDHTVTSGDLSIAIESGLPVKLDVYTDQENTRALFGEQNNVIPSSIRTHMTLELFSQ
ncbi:MAG: hypothetical protein IH600_06140 [Bacteroidetes bacterium]|nr:hypothetical protein [Bacteroidota bacterium]